MAPLYIVFILFCYTKPSETTLAHGGTFDETKNGPNNKNIDFVKEKLIQHNQALEYLVPIIENSEQMLKQLVELLSTKLEQPPMPEKIEVLTPSRRSYGGNDVPEPPIKFEENMRRYGSLNSRRFMGRYMDESNGIVTTEAVDVESSVWCPIALMCVKTSKPVCGFDVNFGHAKFVDTCHMFHVNCYWKYNFGLSSGCERNCISHKNNE